MAVEASASKFRRNNGFIFAAVCIVGALWFGYDGWFGSYHDTELENNAGKPTVNLLFNQYVPIPLAAAAGYFLVTSLVASSRKLAADENGLVINGKKTLRYAEMKSIDKRRFEKEGHFTIEYEQAGKVERLKLSDRKWDNLGVLLDEVVKQTGAEPDKQE